MRYLLLIYGEEARRQNPPPEEMEATLKPWWEYTEWLKEKGWYLAGDALQPTATATTVRERDGKAITTDGPFAETKEQLGGYYLVEAKDLDEAIGIAARVPSARFGSVEVRPVMKVER